MTEEYVPENEAGPLSSDCTANHDYAEEYRPRVARFPNELKSIARFGHDQHGKSQEAEIPDTLQDNYFIRTIVEYVNDPDTKFSTAAGKYRRAFQLIIEVALEHPEMDWRNFGTVFIEKLKVVGQSEHQIKIYNDGARLLFVWAAEKCQNHRLKRDLHEIAGLSSGHRGEVGNWPSLRNPPKEPNRALEDVFGDDLSYSNDQYVASVSEYSAAYIIAWSNIRSRLRSDHPVLMGRIVDAVTNFGRPRLRELETQQVYSAKTKLVKDDWLFLLRLNFEILECLDEPLLNWIAVTQHSRQKGFPVLVSTADVSTKGALGYIRLFQHQTDDGLAPRTRWVYLRERGAIKHLSARLIFSLLDFVGPTAEEELCLRWLLASRRIQSSNVDRLSAPDISEDAKNLYIRSYKRRNGKAEPVKVTKNSRAGRAVRNFLADRIANLDGNIKREPLVGRFVPSRGRFLGTPNFSHLFYPEHVEGLGAYGASENCLRLMKDIFAVVDKANRSIGRADNHGEGERPEVKALNPSFVSQSLVYAEEAKRGGFSVSPTMRLSFEEEDAAEYERNARRQFHSPETRQNTYRARSRDRIMLRANQRFGAAVSEEMTKIALEIIAAWDENTTCHAMPDLVSIIGLRGNVPEAQPETLLAAAKAEKFLVERSGLITRGGKTYLFDSGLTARMMMEEIRSIEGQLEGLFAIQDFDRAVNAWAKYCFLDILLARFSSASLKDAKSKYGHLENAIPHVPMSEGGISWIVE